MTVYNRTKGVKCATISRHKTMVWQNVQNVNSGEKSFYSMQSLAVDFIGQDTFYTTSTQNKAQQNKTRRPTLTPTQTDREGGNEALFSF